MKAKAQLELKLGIAVPDKKKGFILIPKGGPRKTLERYLMKMVPWKTRMQKKLRHSMFFCSSL